MTTEPSYDEANSASFYGDEVHAMSEALKVLERLKSLSGDAYVYSAEIKLGSGGEVFATLWWDIETEQWRAQLTRPVA